MHQEVQQHFDDEARAQRQLAIINYAIVLHTARTGNIPTQFASRALEHMRLEENQSLVDDTLTQYSGRPGAVFQYRRGMFDAEAPGATMPATRPVATPGLDQ